MYFFELESRRAELQSEIPGRKSKETNSRHPQLPSYITLNTSALLTPLFSRDEATSGLNGGPCRHSYCELDNKLPVEGGGEGGGRLRLVWGWQRGEGRVDTQTDWFRSGNRNWKYIKKNVYPLINKITEWFNRTWRNSCVSRTYTEQNSAPVPLGH